jgi:hypothetical protein
MRREESAITGQMQVLKAASSAEMMRMDFSGPPDLP